MALVLNLESSTEVCSVAISKEGELIDFIENDEGQSHAKLLSVFAADLLKRNQLDFNQLDAVAVSKGPGSYTGLRIGVSLAKGICYGNNIPLIAISPLQAMSHHVSHHLADYALNDVKNPLFCPMIDARRMEVYYSIYNQQAEELEKTDAKIIDEDSFSEFLAKNSLVFFGNGASKCQEVIDHPNALFVNNIRTSAQFMCKLSDKAFENNDFVDLAYFEPFYLKKFIAGIPKKNILNR